MALPYAIAMPKPLSDADRLRIADFIEATREIGEKTIVVDTPTCISVHTIATRRA